MPAACSIHSRRPPASLAGRLPLALGIIPAALALAVIAAWHAHVAAVIQLRPTLAPMQYTTALCLLFAGIAFCAVYLGRSRLAQLLGALVAVFATLTLLEYITGFDLGIDHPFVQPYIVTQTSSPGRMSPVTTLCLLQVGIALVLTGLAPALKWPRAVIGSLGAVVLSTCCMAILGYVIGLPGTYGWSQMTRIAPHTALALIFLAIGAFEISWNGPRAPGQPTPRWLPIPIGLATLTASLILSQALASRHYQEVQKTVQARAAEVSAVLSVRIEARILALMRMAERWDFGGHPTQAAWEDDAKHYIRDFPDFQAIEWIDPSYLVRWIEPLEGNEIKLNRNLTLEANRHKAVQEARLLRQPAVTRTIELLRGGLGFIVYVPVFDRDKFDGFIVSVIKVQPFFERVLPAAVASGDCISIFEGARKIYERNPEPGPIDDRWTVETNVDTRYFHWTAAVGPSPETMAQMQSRLPIFVAIAGALMSAMLALTAYLAQAISTRAREAATANKELRAALAEVKTLGGLLPICYDCKRIRDDGGYWNRLENYISKHSTASFSHGLCPECAVKAYKDAGFEVPADVYADLEKRIAT